MLTALVVGESVALAFTGGDVFHLFLCLAGLIFVMLGLGLATGLSFVYRGAGWASPVGRDVSCGTRAFGCLGFIIGVMILIWVIVAFPAISLGIIKIP